MENQEEKPIKQIGDHELNEAETEKLKSSPTFQTFMDWCNKHKIYVHKNLGAPAAFGPLGVPGIAALEDIPANTVIAAIPQKLLISLNQIKKGSLKEIFDSKENEDLFNEKKAGDAEFNIIAAFLIHEKLKDGKSFYQPYFDTIERSYTMYDWTKEEVEETECPELIDEFKHYLEDMEVTWRDLKACLVKYPNFFDKERLTQDLFLWSYELIMTRIFGYSLPCTCLVPFGDLFNHGNHSATHYIVNKLFEREESVAHKQYKIKKNKIDLSIFDTENTGQYKVEGADYHFRSRRFRFVKDHYKVLPSELRNKVDWNTTKFIEDELLSEMMYEINAKELTYNKEVNIWDLKFFTTSATEDNDTDEDQTDGRKKEYDILFKKEIKIVETAQKRSRGEKNTLNVSNAANKSEQDTTLNNGTTAFEQIRNRIHSKEEEEGKSSSGSEFEDESGEEGDDESGEEEEEEEECIQQEKQKKTKEEIIKKDSKEEIKKYKDEIMTQTSVEVVNKEEKKQENKNNGEEGDEDKKGDSSLSDDSDWDWYETQLENTYFAVTTEQPVKKGEQVYLCYGRRTNKFLLQWYGFAFENNLFDSFGFRMWIKPEPHSLDYTKVFDQIIYRNFIAEEDWTRGYVMNNGFKISTRDLTKEFRLKRGHLCDELIVFLRIYLSSHYDKIDCSQILFTIPRSFGFEMFVFEFAKKVLFYIRSRYRTTNEEDEAVLKDHSISYKKRFATVVKLDHKRLLDEQIRMVDTIYIILQSLERNQFDLKKHLEEMNESNEDSVSNVEDKENIDSQSTTTSLSQNDKSTSLPKETNTVPKKEIILTENHTNSLKNVYTQDIEGFGNFREVVKERHKIKKYLEQLYLGIFKQYIL